MQISVCDTKNFQLPKINVFEINCAHCIICGFREASSYICTKITWVKCSHKRPSPCCSLKWFNLLCCTSHNALQPPTIIEAHTERERMKERDIKMEQVGKPKANHPLKSINMSLYYYNFMHFFGQFLLLFWHG